MLYVIPNLVSTSSEMKVEQSLSKTSPRSKSDGLKMLFTDYLGQVEESFDAQKSEAELASASKEQTRSRTCCTELLTLMSQTNFAQQDMPLEEDAEYVELEMEVTMKATSVLKEPISGITTEQHGQISLDDAKRQSQLSSNETVIATNLQQVEVQAPLTVNNEPSLNQPLLEATSETETQQVPGSVQTVESRPANALQAEVAQSLTQLFLDHDLRKSLTQPVPDTLPLSRKSQEGKIEPHSTSGKDFELVTEADLAAVDANLEFSAQRFQELTELTKLIEPSVFSEEQEFEVETEKLVQTTEVPLKNRDPESFISKNKEVSQQSKPALQSDEFIELEAPKLRETIPKEHSLNDTQPSKKSVTDGIPIVQNQKTSTKTFEPVKTNREFNPEVALLDSLGAEFELQNPKEVAAGLEQKTQTILDLQERQTTALKLTQSIQSMVQEERSEVRIQLKPEHLGEMKIKLSLERGIMVAEFVVENETVREIINSQLPQLHTALQEQGAKVSQMTVNIDLGQSKQEQESLTKPRQFNKQQGRGQMSGATLQADKSTYLGRNPWNQVDLRA